jgi:hypothetical protein
MSVAESCTLPPARPRRTRRTVVPRNFAREKLPLFGRVCLEIWPDKTATHLSQRAGCSERHANLLIAGDRKPNARVAHAVLGEIIS